MNHNSCLIPVGSGPRRNKLPPQRRSNLAAGSGRVARQNAMAFALLSSQIVRAAVIAFSVAMLFAPAKPGAAAPEPDPVANQDIALSPQDLHLHSEITWGANPSNPRSLVKSW